MKLTQRVCVLVMAAVVVLAMKGAQNVEAQNIMASVISPPQSVNVSLNGVAEFKCLWTGFTLYWKANKTQLDNTTETVYHEERHDNGTVTSTLKIMEVVLSTYNETYIACVVANLSSNDESLPALLLVQGLLESVGNIIVTPITYFNISWNPPFTLEGIPILGYNVIINYSSSNGSNYSISPYFIEHPNSDNFNVTVVPSNMAGLGNPTSIVYNDMSVSSLTFTHTDSSITQSATISVAPSNGSSPPMCPTCLTTFVPAVTFVIGLVIGPVIGLLIGVPILLRLRYKKKSKLGDSNTDKDINSGVYSSKSGIQSTQNVVPNSSHKIVHNYELTNLQRQESPARQDSAAVTSKDVRIDFEKKKKTRDKDITAPHRTIIASDSNDSINNNHNKIMTQ